MKGWASSLYIHRTTQNPSNGSSILLVISVVGHGREEHIWVVAPNHPIAKGITHFTLPDEEYYAEPFQVAEPETVVFISTFGSGHWFRSGLTWASAKGEFSTSAQDMKLRQQ